MWLFSYLAHIYLYWNFRKIVKSRPWRIAMAAFLSLLALCVFFRSRLFDVAWGETFSDLLFLWVGCLLFLSMSLAVRDALGFLAVLIEKKAAWIRLARPRPSRSLCAALLIGFTLFGYALREAAAIRVSFLIVETEKLPSGTDRIRVAAFSDFHLDRFSKLSRLEKVVDLVNAQEPDSIVVAGDFVDTGMAGRKGELAALLRLRAPLGKYFVTGNHEVYRGVEQAVAFMTSAGFRTLRGEAVETGGIVVAGVDDPLVAGRREASAVLANRNPDVFTLLLSHRPDVPAASLGLFDLQFSGHTHGGQLWPIRAAMGLFIDYVAGYAILPASGGGDAAPGAIYVTNGVGHKRPPVRLFVPPEIVVIDLIRPASIRRNGG